jgi:serine/threonine protein kinase
LRSGISRRPIQGGGLSLHDAFAIAQQIADALDTAHEKGIVHRDLKPANIKVTPDGVVKVLDFGLAKAVTTDSSHTNVTESRDGAILGTAAYMSPEQARGQSVDKRGDIWAFGCVLYEMLTGRLAFPAETISDTIARILEHEPDWSALPAETPVTIRRLLLRCLAKNPKRRLRDIGDARIELDAIAEEPTGGASEPGESRLPSKARTARLPWVVVGVLTLLVFMLWAPWRTVAPREPLRLRADLGADGSLANSIANQYGEATVLSPDGTVVAFVAQKSETGRKQLMFAISINSEPRHFRAPRTPSVLSSLPTGGG